MKKLNKLVRFGLLTIMIANVSIAQAEEHSDNNDATVVTPLQAYENNSLIMPKDNTITLPISATPNLLNKPKVFNVILGKGNVLDLQNDVDDYLQGNIVIGAKNQVGKNIKVLADKKREIVDSGVFNFSHRYAIGMGYDNNLYGGFSVAIGKENNVEDHGVAIGNYAWGGKNGIAIGDFAFANKLINADGIAIGRSAKAQADQSISIGLHAKVSDWANQSLAIGAESKIYGSKAVAIGAGAEVNTMGGVALGSGSVVPNGYYGGVGYDFRTGKKYMATTDSPIPDYAKQDYDFATVSIGDVSNKKYRRITNLAAGQLDQDAVNVGQLKDALSMYAKKADVNKAITALQEDTSKVKTALKDLPTNGNGTTVDNGEITAIQKDIKNTNLDLAEIKDKVNKADKQLGDLEVSTKAFKNKTETNLNQLATADADNQKAFNQVNQRVDNLSNEIKEVDSQSKRGLANAAALAALHMQPNVREKSQIMAGLGFYKGRKALAVGLGYYVNNRDTLTVGLAVNSRDNYMGNVGYTWRIGQAKKLVDEGNLQNEVKDLKAKVAELEKIISKIQADNVSTK